MDLDTLLSKSLATGDLSFDEIVYLLSLTKEDEIERLIQTADAVRREFVGDSVHLRGLIEFSNICARNCNYCGLRCENTNIRRYRMPINEIIETAQLIADMGISTVVLQSGEDRWYSAEKIAEMVSSIKERTGMAITLSIGERTYEEYRIMREAGADRFLLRHETANPELYRKLHPDMLFENRVLCLNNLKRLGFQIGAGSMVGLPGQTIQDIAADVVFVRDIDADMVGIGPFIPHPDTPFGKNPGGTLSLTLKMLAVTRIVTRNVHMPATTAAGSVESNGRIKALQAGANVIMPNYTPINYRSDYEIYPNKQSMTEELDAIRLQMQAIGRDIAEGKGHSYKTNNIFGTDNHKLID